MSGRKFLQSVKDEAVCPCGERRSVLFEFAHYQRGTKLVENGRKIDMSALKCKKKIEKELTKGRYICVFCHRQETHEENKRAMELYLQSLVLSCTQNFKSVGTSCGGTICQGRRLGKSHFKVCKSKCDSCVSLERIMKRKSIHKYINERKLEYSCCEYCGLKCAKDNFHLFEWDHIFGKNRNVSKCYSVKAVENEIKLCRLLCAKCHRLKSILEARNKWKGKPSDFVKLL